MSTATLRHYDLTVGFIPFRHEREMERSLNKMRLRVSRRRFKAVVRGMLERLDGSEE